MRRLTLNQQRFVLAFVHLPNTAGNAAASARFSGYSQVNARVIGGQLLDKPHVRAAIDLERASVAKRYRKRAMSILVSTIRDPGASRQAKVIAAAALLEVRTRSVRAWS